MVSFQDTGRYMGKPYNTEVVSLNIDTKEKKKLIRKLQKHFDYKNVYYPLDNDSVLRGKRNHYVLPQGSGKSKYA